VVVIGLIVFTLNSKDGNLVVGDQGSRYIILCAERVAGAQHDVSPASLQSPHQVRRFRGHMHTSTNTNSGKRPIRAKLLLNSPQNRHLLLRPIHPVSPTGSQIYIFNIIFHLKFIS
jgi:hypothetical protein